MAINTVQLQKGMSIQEFMKQYGTEVQCIAALESQRWPNGFQCPFCSGNKALSTEYKKTLPVCYMYKTDISYCRDNFSFYKTFAN